MCVMLAGSGVVAGRLFWLQVMDSSRMSAMAAEQRLRTLTLPAHRGSILASDGTELAISMDTQTVYASPREIKDPMAAAQALAPILAIDTGKLQAKLTGDSGFVYLARRQDPEIAATRSGPEDSRRGPAAGAEALTTLRDRWRPRFLASSGTRTRALPAWRAPTRTC